MSDYRLLYTTWPDAETAEAAARAAVKDGLAACANILPGMVSVFRWDGAIQREAETVMLLKTTAQQAPALRDALIARHPYDTPAIVALDVDAAASARPFLDWIAACAGPERAAK